MKTNLIIFLISAFCSTSLFGQCFLTGADLSYTNEILSNGGIYKDEAGDLAEPFEFFASKGAKIVRLRLWHTPSNNTDYCGNKIQTCSLDDVLDAAVKVKSNGMQLMLSIHYSDYFADPSKQKRPSAWLGLAHSELLDSISNYTEFVLSQLNKQHTLPDIVSIGNETTWGFIDESSSTNGFDWNVDHDKFNSALNTIDMFNIDHNTSIKKAVHFTESTAIWATKTFLDNTVDNFDIIGFSYYPSFSPETNLDKVGEIVHELTTQYDKEVMIFETGFAWTSDFTDDYNNFISDNGNVLDFLVSEQGQKQFLFQLSEIVKRNNGTGIIYWEPAWVTSGMCDLWGQGSSYENVALFDTNSEPLAAFDFFEFCGSVAVKEESRNRITIYPNPITFDELKIKDVGPDTKWEILDVSGKVILFGDFTNSEWNTIKLTNCSSGIYVLRIFSFAKGYQASSFYLR